MFNFDLLESLGDNLDILSKLGLQCLEKAERRKTLPQTFSLLFVKT